MGLRSPFGYVGNTFKFLDVVVYLLDNFCANCHTNEEYNQGCKGCNIGQLIYEARDYVLDAYEGGLRPDAQATLDKIQFELKTIEPSPMFNASMALSNIDNATDKLIELRRLISLFKYYEFLKGHIQLKQEHKEEVTRRVVEELIKEKRLVLSSSI